ncbi:MBL fold metallo-hydrolase [Rhizobium ruizarguesonis]|uniref:MBL fold metallo-hydrolase n=1 Tax=Rhizobium ruizarguesonis TaxID=2081791 RepID=A0AAE4YL85_9HYPH|nr:MBL fold metallo-hydrolase [Rhizobium ruizarguesonis]TCA30239.1 MBL fold metallo-hydrolase [Rhizobium leguminosarum bv. viciae]MCB2404338.1 MBL fold metallo-hydrolase [Rhizobium ruizarguesonis]NEI46870.1 MBL fold metallo-hydrolase [Rhizobium ruizarguesonis]TAT98465.1 MBL fold metallo-hydrolase [Rhizobium ruizarguesonis]TAZ17738.1 MBL fold metallo-hydrolase [Rhizobium ruizarguesonis]
MAISSGIKRRTLFAAGLGLLAAPAIFREKAEAAATGESNHMDVTPLPEINQFKLGSYKFTVVRDGTSIVEKPYETFGTNQDPETVKSLLTANFLPADKFMNGYTPALIDTGSDVILVDTGFGAGGRARGAGQLTEGLKAAGYSTDDVTLVALTHLHGDHIGGLMEDGAAAFKNARYVVGQAEYDFWSDKAREGTPAEGGHKAVLANVVPLAEKTTFIKEGDSVAPGVTAMLASGHSPGHMVFHVESEGKRLVLTGDTANHYILSLLRPDWEVRFDMDKTQAAVTRRKVFEMIASEKIAFLGYHMPFPAVGFVGRQDGGYRFVPKTYQFDI